MTGGVLPYTETGANKGRFELSNLDDSKTERTLNYLGNQVARVEGLRLDGHFQITGVGWLIVTDYDCMFEEAICFHLFDEDFQRLDFIALGKMYCPGILLHLSAVGEREFSFEFPGKNDWHKLWIEPWTEGFLFKKTRWLKVTLANGEPSPFV
jgi:hypothetical protein